MNTSPQIIEALAAGLAARLIHDFAGPLSGVVSGLDLHADSRDEDLRASGLDLAAASARSLLDMLEFGRVAYAAAGGPLSGQEVARLAAHPFAGRRARLVWLADLPSFSPLAAQTVLILAQIVAGALGAGGSATVTSGADEKGELVLKIAGDGARAALAADTLRGLAGKPATVDGLPGRWAPARYLHAIVTSAGGRVAATTLPGVFTIEAALPV